MTAAGSALVASADRSASLRTDGASSPPSAADRPRFTLNWKSSAGLSRVEFEREIDEAVFHRLWPRTSSMRLQKVRTEVIDPASLPDECHPNGSDRAQHPSGPSGRRCIVWELDRFLDRSLVLAEVELEDESDPIAIPEWLLPVLVREVTGDSTFANSTLARHRDAPG